MGARRISRLRAHFFLTTPFFFFFFKWERLDHILYVEVPRKIKHKLADSGDPVFALVNGNKSKVMSWEE